MLEKWLACKRPLSLILAKYQNVFKPLHNSMEKTKYLEASSETLDLQRLTCNIRHIPVKRIFDILFSLCVLAFFSPLFSPHRIRDPADLERKSDLLSRTNWKRRRSLPLLQIQDHVYRRRPKAQQLAGN